jgi:hypothetical protein
VVLDQTGVGEFVVGPFREAGLNPIPVIITGGVKPTYSWRGRPPRRPSHVAAKATVSIAATLAITGSGEELCNRGVV